MSVPDRFARAMTAGSRSPNDRICTEKDDMLANAVFVDPEIARTQASDLGPILVQHCYRDQNFIHRNLNQVVLGFLRRLRSIRFFLLWRPIGIRSIGIGWFRRRSLLSIRIAAGRFAACCLTCYAGNAVVRWCCR
jgi:hypothetical protein